MIDFSIIHNGMVALLALLGTLLISLAIMIYDHTSSDGQHETILKNGKKTDENKIYHINSFDKVLPWERTLLLKRVALAPCLLFAFLLASLCLILLGIDIRWLRYLSLTIYAVSVLFIVTRIWSLGKWLYSQADTTTKETYRQKKKYKYLSKPLDTASLYNTWSITWANMNPSNPHLAQYLTSYLDGINSISNDGEIWHYFEIFFNSAKQGNIDVLRPDMQKIILQYALDGLVDSNNNKPQIKYGKRRMVEYLLESALLKEDASICYTFDIVEKFLKGRKNNYEIMHNFATLFFFYIDKTQIDNDRVFRVFTLFPHAEWGVGNLLLMAKNKQNVKEYAIAWLRVYISWFGSRYVRQERLHGQARLEANERIEVVSQDFIGQTYFTGIGTGILGDLLIFYSADDRACCKDENIIENSLVKFSLNSGRLFMPPDIFSTYVGHKLEENDEDQNGYMVQTVDAQLKEKDKNTIEILKYVYPLSDQAYVEMVLKVIKGYKNKTDKISDKRHFQLKLLEYDFELINEFNKEKDK